MAVELDGVSFAYRHGVLVLDAVSLRVAAGEFVAIAGPNGGGKTTLLRLVLGLERPLEGTVTVFGGAPGRRGGPRDRIPASAGAARRRRARRPCARWCRPAGWHRAACSARCGGPTVTSFAGAIARVGLESRVDTPLRELSGGLQQRAFIAKALAAEPSLLALDEPTTGVDAESQESLAALLEELRAELGVTILYVSHEFGAVEHVVERLVLVRGGVVFDGPPGELPGLWHDPSHHHDH